MSKVYLITEAQMQSLFDRLELAAMTEANVLGQKWSTVGARPANESNPSAEDFKYSAYEVWRACNFVLCRWKSEMERP